MASFKVKVIDINGEPVANKTVKACKQGFDKSCFTGDTAQDGIVDFSFPAWQEAVEVTVEGFTTGGKTIQIDILGNAQPNFITIPIAFKPLDNLGKGFAQFGDYLKGLGTIATILIVIALIVLAIWYAKKHAPTISNYATKAVASAKTAVAKVRRKGE